MGHKKLIRFEAIKSFSNVFEHPVNVKGAWASFFKNDHPIIIELACGRGEYAVGLGEKYPHKNFIGVDIKGNRIWAGAKMALEKKLRNVLFLRTQIDQLPQYFATNEISEIWITFPDPQLRLSRAKKRLTHPKFLRIYQQCLQHSGVLHLKTDSPALYLFTKQVIDLYQLPLLTDIPNIALHPNHHQDLTIKTHYEILDIAKSNRIHYLQFQIHKPLPPELDAQLKQWEQKNTPLFLS